MLHLTKCRERIFQCTWLKIPLILLKLKPFSDNFSLAPEKKYFNYHLSRACNGIENDLDDRSKVEEAIERKLLAHLQHSKSYQIRNQDFLKRGYIVGEKKMCVYLSLHTRCMDMYFTNCPFALKKLTINYRGVFFNEQVEHSVQW